jgi:hypothetical protein
MAHVRAHRQAYLSAFAIVVLALFVAGLILAPRLGVTLTMSGLLTVGVILLIAGAIFRAILHAISSLDHSDDASSISGQQG